MAVWSGSKKWRLGGIRKRSLWHLECKGLVINWVASQASDKSPKNGFSLLGRAEGLGVSLVRGWHNVGPLLF